MKNQQLIDQVRETQTVLNTLAEHCNLNDADLRLKRYDIIFEFMAFLSKLVHLKEISETEYHMALNCVITNNSYKNYSDTVKN